MRISDWSADVCSSDLPGAAQAPLPKDSADLALARLDHFRNANGGSPTDEIRHEMQRAMSAQDRKRVVEGKSVSVRLDIGGRRNITKKNQAKHNHSHP